MLEALPPDPGSDPTSTPFRARVAARPANVRALRDQVGAWIDVAAPSETAHRADAVLIVSELFTNAVEAGANEIETVVYRSLRCLRIVVTDDGPDWVPALRSTETPDATALRGRGLALAARLGDLVVERLHQRTRVMVTLGTR